VERPPTSRRQAAERPRTRSTRPREPRGPGRFGSRFLEDVDDAGELQDEQDDEDDTDHRERVAAGGRTLDLVRERGDLVFRERGEPAFDGLWSTPISASWARTSARASVASTTARASVVRLAEIASDVPTTLAAAGTCMPSETRLTLMSVTQARRKLSTRI
jgi:hypothetical protein